MAHDGETSAGMGEWRPTDALEGLGRRLAYYRRLEGMSAQELAEETGLTRSVIANIETGRRGDITVRELLLLAEALRVPPAALMFDIAKPFAPARWRPVAERDREMLEDFFRPRIVNAIEWLSASDSESLDPELADFEKGLEGLEAVVVYPFGNVISATYGPGGRKARALINAARNAERAAERREGARQDVIEFARLVWSHRDDEDAQLESALDAGLAATSAIGAELVAASEESDRPAVEAVLKECDAATRNLRDAMAQLSNLGADAERSEFGGARGTMHLVRSSPHESLAKMKEDARLAGGKVDAEEYRFSSPLHESRYDRLEKLRARFARRQPGER